MATASAQERFLELLRAAIAEGTLAKLTLGGPCGTDATLQNAFVRPVTLRDGRRLQFVYRHATRDVTKNLKPDEALLRIMELLGHDFRTAHLFTTKLSAELEIRNDKARLRLGKPSHAEADTSHDRVKQRLIDPQAPWLHELGVTAAGGAIRKEMGDKFRQINKFVEILSHLLLGSRTHLMNGGTGLRACPNEPPQAGTPVPPEIHGPARGFTNKNVLRLVDMGCGKGYLTFAAYDWLRENGCPGAEVVGIEARPELVELCNRVARSCRLTGLRFEAGTIETYLPVEGIDVLVALHACDTATDDAMAKGVKAGASLIIVAPCCHKEVRPQLRAPPVLASALKHGILLERQAEFVTDALRAALLEWAGYETKVFEFISTEHTAKNLMIAAVKRQRPVNHEELGRQVRELAAFYGIERQQLAEQLGFRLAKSA